MDQFAGDPSEPVQVELVLDRAGDLITVSDHDRADLLPPPQGGFVMYAGVRAKNISSCGAQLRGQLRDAATLVALSDFDLRSSDFEPEKNSNWWVPTSLANFDTVPNIPVCPDNSGGSVLGKEVLLSVRLSDRSLRTATAEKLIVPSCPNDGCRAMCECICSAGTQPGKCSMVAPCER